MRLVVALVAALALSPVAAQARGTRPDGRRAWTLDLATVAEASLGAGKFTRLPGAWCADAVSAWLVTTGRRPLANRMASSALAYGPLELHPRRGDLAVIATRAGRYGHVGIVVAERGNAVEIISGNWGRRVARAVIPRSQVVAFVRV